MQTENLRSNNCSQRKVVEQLSKLLPNFSISILSQAFIIKPVNLSDLSALMISSEDSQSLWISDFQSNKQSDSLNWVIASINVISHEQVISIRGLSSNLEKFAQVMELSMDITTDSNWCWNTLNVWLLNQNFFGLLTKISQHGNKCANGRSSKRDRAQRDYKPESFNNKINLGMDFELLTLSQRALTWDSGNGLHVSKCLIYSSNPWILVIRS